MARLSLSVLGLLQITLDGQPVSGFVYNKARALLAYLAVEADRPHHRDALVGLLWPELPDRAARTNLRQALANLREAIGDATATPPFLLITRDTIQLNPASDYDLDVATFTALLTTCETHAHRRPERCRSCAARMEQAIALYRADFLAGFAMGDSAPFEEWQLLHRERLHQRALDALMCLADYHERCGADEQARRLAERQIELDPWREEAHRQLMRLLARGHQRSAALAQYETCRRELARDLSVEPEAETTALYERIRNSTSSELRVLSAELPAQGHETQTSNLKPQNVQNFPAQPTLLIGRETELAELGALLENPSCRLITIVGPGGIGKTRLALAAATDQATTFRHGAVFVPLAAISSAVFVAPAILAALGVALQGQRDPREQLLEYLRGQELLLVLDNFEQLLAPDLSQNAGGAALLTDMLQRAPSVTLLVTSRERLALQGEWLFDMSGLSYPLGEPTESFEAYSAVQLFLQCASQVHRQFVLAEGEARAVARICRLTEGMPLAIELAAASVRHHMCATIAADIEAGARMLSTSLRDVPERHRSIWAAFEHSWRLLSEHERLALRRLAVFRGGFEEDAAAQIDEAAPNLLASLMDKSLLRRSEAGRYDMHELVRQYAQERLEEAGEAEATYTRHLRFFLTLAVDAEPRLDTQGRQLWLVRLDAELDNLRVALGWSLQQWEMADEAVRNTLERPVSSLPISETFTPAELGTQLAAALGRFWFLRRYRDEGRGWLLAAIPVCRASIADSLAMGDRGAIHHAQSTLAKLLLGVGALESIQGEYGRALGPLEESLTLFRAQGDRRGTALALRELGAVLGEHERYDDAATLLEEALALFRAQGDQWHIASLLYHLGMNATDRGDSQRGAAQASESLALFREFGERGEIISSLNALAMAVMAQGDYARAGALLEEGLALDQAVNPRRAGSAWTLANLALAAHRQGDYTYAAACYRESMVLRIENQNRAGVACSLEGLAELSWVSGAPLRAARLWGAAETLRTAAGAGMTPDERARHDRAVAVARTQLDEATWLAAWAEGQAMTLEQAGAYALEGSEIDAVSSIIATAATPQ
jgi:predicted ATPase/DNA-binding SARP family transcriptional activator